MKLHFSNLTVVLLICSFLSFILFKTAIIENDLGFDSHNKQGKEFLNDETNKPDEWMKQELWMTMDPKTGKIPFNLLFEEYERTRNLIEVDPSEIFWEERGPFNVGGRTRAIMWDPNDPNHNKFWAGGVSGGLWYTENMTEQFTNWHKVDDFWDNLAISCITYDPTNTQIFYVGTGEGWFDHYGIPGGGIWKSSDGGITWNHLPSTNLNDDFEYVQKIIVHPVTGDVYAATKHSGVMRSIDEGANWNVVLSAADSSLSNRATDLEITADNNILAALGLYAESDGIYISSTGDLGDWTRINDGTNDFPTAADGIKRIELAVAPSDANIIYALVQNGLINRPSVIDSDIKGIYRSSDKGESWVSLTIPILRTENGGADTIFFSATQTGYDLIAAVHPNDPDIVFVGGISMHRSVDGGNAWETIEGIHADHHALDFRPEDPQTLVFGNDGGIYLTFDCTVAAPVIHDRNYGYRVTQFHTCALHPGWGEDYFMGGTQDNYTQIFSSSGMNNTRGVLFSDGGYCYIFKNNPSYQLASKWGNRFYLSTDGGNEFNPIYDNKKKGIFISPWDYDENDDVMYASYNKDSILIIKDVTSSHTATIQTYNGQLKNWSSAFKVSPFSDKTLFIGTTNGELFKITNASSVSDYNVDTLIATGFNQGWINCVELGANEDQILVIYNNFGIISVWETLDGGAHWIDKEGDLPSVPIRWGIYNPLDYRQVLVATDLGVYTTEDITANPVHWVSANNGMGNVRTTMLKTRASDNLVIASTYGRGIFSTNAFAVSPSTKILASDGQVDDDFGTSVATNGDFAIVGAPQEDENGNNAGAVYFYEQLNNQWNESAKVLAPDGAADDHFGGSVDMFGDLAIVGARLDDPSGSAYIYRLSGSSWNLESKITPNDGISGDNFGHSVAIFGDRAVVGATGSGDFGAVYVFTYQTGSWIQTDKIEPNDGEIGDLFGHSVDLDGNYLVVGNPFDNDNGQFSGSAYIYHYDGGWTLDKKVTANDGDEYDSFGYSVAIDGQNAVIGAYKDEGINGHPEAGSAYVYFNSVSSNWEQRAKLWAQDAWNYQNFGISVSIYGDYIIVGAEHDIELDYWSGAAYVFRYDGSVSTWLQQNKLFPEDGERSDLFGHSVHFYGTTAIVSSIGDDDNGDNSGSAYIFKSIANTNNLPILSVTPPSFELSSSQTTIDIQIHNNYPAFLMHWTAYAIDPWLQIVGDTTGTNSGTVTINVDENLYCPRTGRIIIRAPGAVHSPREVFIHQQGGPNPKEVKITSEDLDAYDYFGNSVDVDGEYAIVGARKDHEFGTDAGAAYIFKRDGCCSWVQKAKLRLNDPENYDQLGISVAISGDIALVGVWGDNSAYVFEKPVGGWEDMTETAILSTSPGTSWDVFGWSLDIDGEYAIVGAPTGKSIFIYERPSGGWQDMVETFYYNASSLNWNGFGISVAIDENYAVVGATNFSSNQPGVVSIFKRDWVWGFQTELVPSDSQIDDLFGSSVDINNDRVIVGAENVEAAYIFVKENDAWIEEQKLTGGTSFAFGNESVSIDGQYAVVGALQYSDSLYLSGTAYSYIRNDMGWSFSKQIFNSDMGASDFFGGAVSMSGPYTIIGADGKINGGNQYYAGAAYIYCTEGDIVTSVSTPPEQTLPIEYDLKQNYPNPFNPVTTIEFDLPRASTVTLKIYTILGEEITTLVSDKLPAGTHRYFWNPSALASGVYLYRIESKEYTKTKKMVFLK